jgi:lysophospholipase L1-like esterase
LSFVYRFSFGADAPDPEFVQVLQETHYDSMLKFGYVSGNELSRDEDKRDSLPGDCFLPPIPTFLLDLPDGNYIVSVTFGNPNQHSELTVKSGPGRLMLENVKAEPGQSVRVSFAVHVENGQLKIAFGGKAPHVKTVEVVRDPAVPTLFVAGDSTVTDQPSRQFPYAGWGQMIPYLLNSSIAVSNHARSGRSTKSFIREGRLELIWQRMLPGDYLFIQFAHNDEKDNDGGTEPHTTYKQYLKVYTDGAKQRGAFPVLVTPMHRRFFDEEGNIQNTHGEYIAAMKQFSIDEQIPLIDLASRSKELFERAGVEGSKHIFMWTQSGEYANFPEGTQDNTHFQLYGAIEIAKLVIKEIKDKQIKPLLSFVR